MIIVFLTICIMTTAHLFYTANYETHLYSALYPKL